MVEERLGADQGGFSLGSLWEPGGGPTSCVPDLWAFCSPGGCAEAKPGFGFVRLGQPTLLGSWWDMECVVGKSKLRGHQGLRSEAVLTSGLLLACLSTSLCSKVRS